MKLFFAILFPVMLLGQERPNEIIRDSVIIDSVLCYGHNSTGDFHATSVRENFSCVEAHNWTLKITRHVPSKKFLFDNFIGIRTCLYCGRKELVHDTTWIESHGVTDAQIRELARRHEQ